MTESPQPTPEDFERAKRGAARLGRVFGTGCDCSACRDAHALARCYTDALSRLEAAERKIEAWGPIVERLIDWRNCADASALPADLACMLDTLVIKPGDEDMTTKHTKGPWKLRGSQIRAANDQHVGSYTSNIADGRLIAAAPLLLEAVLEARKLIGFNFDGETPLAKKIEAALAACELSEQDKALWPREP